MINVLLAYDDNDEELGDYFDLSYNDIADCLNNAGGCNLTVICGLECTESNVASSATQLNTAPYVFIGLSHGNEEQLLTINDVFVDHVNVTHFSNSFFYTPACLSAQQLGTSIVDTGAHSFVGCFKETYATFEEHYPTYIACENYCIKEFLTTDKSIGVAFKEMMDYFDQQIDLMFDANEILVGMELQDNKDSFHLFTGHGLTREDFRIVA